MEKTMAPYSSTLAWKIPWMEEPGGLQTMGSLRVGHDRATSLSLFTFMHWRRKWQPTPVFLSGECQGWGSLVGCRLWGRTVGHDWSDLAAAAAERTEKNSQVFSRPGEGRPALSFKGKIFRRKALTLNMAQWRYARKQGAWIEHEKAHFWQLLVNTFHLNGRTHQLMTYTEKSLWGESNA